MTTVRTFFAGIAVIRDLFILIAFTLGAGKAIDFMAVITGQTVGESVMFGFIQPAFPLFYVFVFLLGLTRIGYFFLTAIQRVDYVEDFG